VPGSRVVSSLLALVIAFVALPLLVPSELACAAGRGAIESFIKDTTGQYRKDTEQFAEDIEEKCGDEGGDDKPQPLAIGPLPKPRPPGPGPGIAVPLPGGVPPGGFGIGDYEVQWARVELEQVPDGSPFNPEMLEQIFEGGRFTPPEIVVVMQPDPEPAPVEMTTSEPAPQPAPMVPAAPTPTPPPSPPAGPTACNPSASTGNAPQGPAAIAVGNDNSFCSSAPSIVADAVAGASELLLATIQAGVGKLVIFNVQAGQSPFRFVSVSANAAQTAVGNFDVPLGQQVSVTLNNVTLGQMVTVTFTVGDAGGGHATISGAGVS